MKYINIIKSINILFHIIKSSSDNFGDNLAQCAAALLISLLVYLTSLAFNVKQGLSKEEERKLSTSQKYGRSFVNSFVWSFAAFYFLSQFRDLLTFTLISLFYLPKNSTNGTINIALSVLSLIGCFIFVIFVFRVLKFAKDNVTPLE